MQRSRYIREFDSLRLFAFFMVILYHLASPILSAGFLGVNLFFALSGFLMTGKALDRFDLRRRTHQHLSSAVLSLTWQRVRRLLPGVLLMLMLSTVLLLFSTSDLRVDYFRQLAGVLGFTTNQYEILSGGSYEAQFIPHIFIHTWTLAIELHLFVFWLIVLLVLFHRARHDAERFTPLEASHSLRKRILTLSLVLIILSELAGILGATCGVPIATLYFSDLTRLAPFFIGSLLAALLGLRDATPLARDLSQRLPAPLFPLAFLIGASALITLARVFAYTDLNTYRLGFLCADLCITLLLATARLRDLSHVQPHDRSVLRTFADLTYGLYLFHWPLWVVLSLTRLPHGLAMVLTVVLALLFAAFSLWVWEPFLLGKRLVLPRPFHQAEAPKRLRQESRNKLSYGALIALALTALLAIYEVKSAPMLLQLENRLWAQSLIQERDAAQQERAALGQQISAEKEEATLEATAREEGFTMVGDSVTLGMRPYLLEEYPTADVDGKVSRFLHDAPDILQERITNGTLKNTVVIQLGNNVYPNFQTTSEEIAEMLPNGARLIFITPYEDGAGADNDIERYAAYLPQLAAQYAYVTIADWNTLSKAHVDIYKGTDGVHFYAQEEGIPLYLDMLQQALQESLKKPAKGES